MLKQHSKCLGILTEDQFSYQSIDYSFTFFELDNNSINYNNNVYIFILIFCLQLKEKFKKEYLEWKSQQNSTNIFFAEKVFNKAVCIFLACNKFNRSALTL